MTERERLIELISNSTRHCLECGCDVFDDSCKYKSEEQCQEKRIADYLLANGVVVLPCKVGDNAYYINNANEIVETNVGAIRTDFTLDEGIGIYGILNAHDYTLGETWFLTREEAEKALKELKANE